MKKLLLLLIVVGMPLVLSACASSRCEVEPIVQENHKLIVPPDFGKMPQ